MWLTWCHIYLFCILIVLNNIKLSQCYMKPKIVGGSFAKTKQYPHVVFIHMYCPGDFTCGSSILNQRILITAAHCVSDCTGMRKFEIAAFAGTEDVSKNYILRKVKKIIHHRKYNETTVENDIALLGMEKSFPLNGNIKRIIIPRKFPHLHTAIVAGWGITNEKTSHTFTRLKFVTQKLRSKRTCALIGHLESTMFCAGSEHNYDPHPAPGDSGSGLITSNFQLIGLVSFRRRKIPALLVYTNVTSFYDWILKKSKELFCELN